MLSIAGAWIGAYACGVVDTTFADGQYGCDPDASGGCPPGLVCAVDGRCRHERGDAGPGDDIDADDTPPPPPDVGCVPDANPCLGHCGTVTSCGKPVACGGCAGSSYCDDQGHCADCPGRDHPMWQCTCENDGGVHSYEYAPAFGRDADEGWCYDFGNNCPKIDGSDMPSGVVLPTVGVKGHSRALRLCKYYPKDDAARFSLDWADSCSPDKEIMGFAFTDPICGATPIGRFVNPGNGDRITKHYGAPVGDYQMQKPLGYAYTP